jgi:Tfp pilus assembly protein PilF
LIVLLVVAVAGAYLNTFRVPLLLDDLITISGNPSIRRLSDIGTVLSPSRDTLSCGRPLLNLTFALNYAADGERVPGYHVLNLLIHAAAALLLFGIVRRTLALRSHPAPRADRVAWVVAALWALHPLATNAVTYVSQRAESLMGLCYLGAGYCLIRAATASARSTAWCVGAVLASAAGMATKEVMVTAPVLLLLFDRTFLATTWREVWRRRGLCHLGLAATWLLLAYLSVSTHLGSRVAGGTMGSLHNLLVESQVVMTYLGRAVWPGALVFDQGPSGWTIAGAWPWIAMLLLAATFGGACVAWWRGHSLAWCVVAWFILLAPTSSVVPIIGQPLAESRTYLPLIPMIAGIVVVADRLLGRYRLFIAVSVAIALGILTLNRNHVYRSADAIWTDTVLKCPGNERAHNALGVVFSLDSRKSAAAAEQFRLALVTKPDFPEAHNNLGRLLGRMPGREVEAASHFAAALQANPDYADAHTNFGVLLARIPGYQDAAEAHYRAALATNPGSIAAKNNLAKLLAAMPGREAEAISWFESALRDAPDSAVIHGNLGSVLMRLAGRETEAAEHLRESLRLDPNSAAIHSNYGLLLSRQSGRENEARAEFETALRLAPDLADAHSNLGMLLARHAGEEESALRQLETALRLNPKDANAHYHAGVVLKRTPGRTSEALAHLKAALQLQPNFAAAKAEVDSLTEH